MLHARRLDPEILNLPVPKMRAGHAFIGAVDEGISILEALCHRMSRAGIRMSTVRQIVEEAHSTGISLPVLRP